MTTAHGTGRFPIARKTTPTTGRIKRKQPSFAWCGPYYVRIAAGLCCPHCRAELEAHDVAVDDSGWWLICPSCHQDVARVSVPE